MYRITVNSKSNPQVEYDLSNISDWDFAVMLVNELIKTKLFSKVTLMEYNNGKTIDRN